MLLAISVATARPLIPVGTPESQSRTAANGVTAKRGNNGKKTETYRFTAKQLWEVNGKLPPKIVLEFLEHPTMENAKRYLAWERARAKKIDEAIALLEKIRQEEAIGRLRKIPLSRINDSKITMFFSPTCPYCLRELNVIKEIKEKYPQVGIELYPVSNPLLAEARLSAMGLGKFLSYSKANSKIARRVTAIPFIIVSSKSTGKIKAKFVGETSYERIIGSM